MCLVLHNGFYSIVGVCVFCLDRQGFKLRQFSFYFACLFLSWRLLHIRYGFIFYLFLFFCCCCLILLAKISARFWHTVFSRLGDAFVKFFCSFSSIECVLHLFSNVSPLKFQFHVKFTFLYWFSLQVNKFCLVQQIKQLIYMILTYVVH